MRIKLARILLFEWYFKTLSNVYPNFNGWWESLNGSNQSKPIDISSHSIVKEFFLDYLYDKFI